MVLMFWSLLVKSLKNFLLILYLRDINLKLWNMVEIEGL